MPHIATADQRRQHALYAASALSDAASRRASEPDKAVALACAFAADNYRVQAALWTRAGARSDSYGAFFAMADKVLRSAANATPLVSGLLERSRESYVQACSALNVPLVLPRGENLSGLSDVNMAGLRDLVTSGRPPEEFVASTLLEAARTNLYPAVRTRMTVHAYLVDVAHRSGDTAMVSAAARLAALDDLTGHLDDPTAVLTFSVKFLGPVEEVRLRPYMRKAGIA